MKKIDNSTSIKVQGEIAHKTMNGDIKSVRELRPLRRSKRFTNTLQTRTSSNDSIDNSTLMKAQGEIAHKTMNGDTKSVRELRPLSRSKRCVKNMLQKKALSNDSIHKIDNSTSKAQGEIAHKTMNGDTKSVRELRPLLRSKRCVKNMLQTRTLSHNSIHLEKQKAKLFGIKKLSSFDKLISQIKTSSSRCVDLSPFVAKLTDSQLKKLRLIIKSNKNISHIKWGNNCKAEEVHHTKKTITKNSNLRKCVSHNIAQLTKIAERRIPTKIKETLFDTLINRIEKKDSSLQVIDLRFFLSTLTACQLRKLYLAIRINENISHIEWATKRNNEVIARYIDNAIINNNIIRENNFRNILESAKKEAIEQAPLSFEELIDRIDKGFLQSIDLCPLKLSKAQLRELHLVIRGSKHVSHIEWGSNRIDERLVADIEATIINNNINYRHHPSDFELLLLSSFTSFYKDETVKEAKVLFYKKDDDKFNKFVEGWYVQDHFFNEDSKFYAVLYKKGNQRVLSIRGLCINKKEIFATNSTILTTFKGAIQRQLVPGHIDTVFLANKLAALAQKGFDITVAGYSLGGWLAKLCAYYCYDYFGIKNVKTVSFDAPGAFDQIERISNIVAPEKADIQYMDSVSYVAVPNVVACSNRHIGKLYRIFPALNLYDGFERLISDKHRVGQRAWAEEGMKFTDVVHDLRAIVRAFDSTTGEPKRYECLKEWPTLFYKKKIVEKLTKQKETQGLVNPRKTAIPLYTNFIYNIVPHVYPKQMIKTLSFMDLHSCAKGKSCYEIRKNLSIAELFELNYVGRYRTFPKDFDNVLYTKRVCPEWYMVQIKQLKPDDTIIGRQLKIIQSKYFIKIAQGRRYAIMKEGIRFNHVKDHILRLMLCPNFYEIVTTKACCRS